MTEPGRRRRPFARCVAIRADGSERTGIGHLMRMLAVADELARTGARIVFLSRETTAWWDALCHASGHELRRLPLAPDATEADDADATLTELAEVDPDVVVLDHYGLAGGWTQAVRQGCHAPLVAFDDVPLHPRQVDMLIDPGPDRDPEDYAGLVPPSADCLVGAAYAPLRPEFALARCSETPTPRRAPPFKVGLVLGGSDPDGTVMACLDALDGLEDLEIHAILSSAAPHLAALRARASRMRVPVQIEVDCTDMAGALSSFDVAIGAGGSSALERCVLGVPTLMLVLAENQMPNARALQRAGAVRVLSAPEELRHALPDLLADSAARYQMSSAARGLCDGLGSTRAAAAIAVAGQGARTPILRSATEDDLAFVHKVQSEPGARRFSRNPKVPTWTEHSDWFTKRIRRVEKEPFYILEVGGQSCGFVRLDARPSDDAFELSVLISTSRRGEGLGHAAIGLLRLAHPLPDTLAHVQSDNAASQRLFAGAGYRRLGPERFVSAGWAAGLRDRQTGRTSHED